MTIFRKVSRYAVGLRGDFVLHDRFSIKASGFVDYGLLELRRRVDLQVVTNASEKHVDSIFRTEVPSR